MPGKCAVHTKAIDSERFGYTLWYLIKSPCKEYSIGKRAEPDKKTGRAKYKQNCRAIRHGHRVKLFHLMECMDIHQLAMAGSDGRELLRKIKYEALRNRPAK
jgi:hypothetical protein